MFWSYFWTVIISAAVGFALGLWLKSRAIEAVQDVEHFTHAEYEQGRKAVAGALNRLTEVEKSALRKVFKIT